MRCPGCCCYSAEALQEREVGIKVYIYIAAFSKRICYYDNVMDVLVQHHPEYISLAWGAMKLVFGVGLHPKSLQVGEKFTEHLLGYCRT